MGLPLMSLLMAVVVSQAAASEDEGAQENQENPMDGRTTAVDFEAQQTREEEVQLPNLVALLSRMRVRIFQNMSLTSLRMTNPERRTPPNKVI